LTNYHVVSSGGNISVTFNNKKKSPAKIVNYDASLDLAVIKVTDSSIKMPAVAELGDSNNLQVGDQVVAIGNPLGEDFYGTVTSGVVSALNRQVQVESSSKPQTFIQTDAAINPGNSGGPLINSLGQVIGITSDKISSTSSESSLFGGSSGTSVEGMGFAIPIDVVKTELSSLTKQMLKIGITVRDISSDEAKQYNVPVGVCVTAVDQFSAGEKAGLQVDDIITKFDGQTVTTTDQLNALKAKHNAGDTVQIVVYRGNSYKTLSLTLTQ
jgi:serine protease Do